MKQNNNEDHEDMLRLSLSIGSNSHAPPPSSSMTTLTQPPSPTLVQQQQQQQHSMPALQFFSFQALPAASVQLPPPPPHAYMPPPPLPLPPPPPLNPHCRSTAGPSRPSRPRRSPAQSNPGQGKSETIPAPYTWATTKRATIHSLEYLLSNGISTISGKVECKRCEKVYDMEYDLQEKFTEVSSFIKKNKVSMHHRAPSVWMNPTLPNCRSCNQNNCVKPCPSKKRDINWLFLLLGQMLGCCKLSELKYFCKHTKNHRTGAKDRVLYLTYLGISKQLDPSGPFDPFDV